MPPPPISGLAEPPSAPAAADADGALAIGRWVRATLAGQEPPLLALQTTASFLRGTVSARDWALALAGLLGEEPPTRLDRRGGNHPGGAAAVVQAQALLDRRLAAPRRTGATSTRQTHGRRSSPWALLADLGDLAGLPACIEHWGREHVAAGATVPLATAPGCARLALCLAPEADGYRALCRWLSWRNEDEAGWDAWQRGDSVICPDLDGVVALVDDAAWAERLAWHGATVHWWLGSPTAGGPAEYPPVVAPLLTGLDGSEATGDRLLALIQERSQVRMHVEAARVRHAGYALSDLPEVLAAFADHEEAIARGRALLARCTHVPGAPGPDGRPRWQLPTPSVADVNAELRRLCVEGLSRRYWQPYPREVLARLDHELRIISGKGFASYILAVWELARGRITCGRGSAASSLICYLLGLTNVDPVRYHLLFDRFFSEERFDPPDIDIDFPWDERDRILEATFARHGHERVAMVSTHLGMRPRSALREAGRVLGRGDRDISALQRRIAAAEEFGQGGGAGPGWDEVLASAEAVTGSLRGFGLHCGGIVITSDPVRELVPVHRAAKQVEGKEAGSDFLRGAGLPAIAWEKDGAELLGLVKIDWLGNRSLAVIRDVLDDLPRDGFSIDQLRWNPADDLPTNRMIAQGRTMGCFYIESPAQRQLNCKAGVVDFDRLVVQSSIIRPAGSGWINIYLQRLHEFRRTGEQKEEWYPHPALKALLSESFGVLSYQEDVMLVAKALAGFDARQQNQLRKALGRDDMIERLESLVDDFIDGCRANGVAEEVMKQVWLMIGSFSGYSFTKAHSASYVMVSYSCAWLKAHHPAHFLARVIHHRGGFYQRTAYVEEARRLGIAILPPSILTGDPHTRAEGPAALRLGLDLIHGARAQTLAAILRERDVAPLLGVLDLWFRCRPGPAELEALLHAGALDGLLAPPDRDGNRAPYTPGQLAWLVRRALATPRPSVAEDEWIRQEFAREFVGDPEVPEDLPSPSQRAIDVAAWRVLACLPRAHPFALWDLPRERRWQCRDVVPRNDGRDIALLVWVITDKQVAAIQRHARDGSELAEPLSRPMSFVTLEDETGIAESTWFPEPYRRYGVLIAGGAPFWVSGRVVVEFGVATIEIARAASLTEVAARGR